MEFIEEKAREAYKRREIEYPVDHALGFAFGQEGSNENPYAADFLKAWAQAKFGVELPLAHVQGSTVRKLRDELIGYQREWLTNGKIDALADAIVKENPTTDALARALNQRFGLGITPKELEQRLRTSQEAPVAAAAGDGEEEERLTPRDFVVRSARYFLRKELSDLEQFVLISILDQSWKDHLYAMDLLRNSIGLQAFAERDPRVLYKKEGYRFFEEMMMNVREKVSDLIFRARVQGQAQARSSYHITATQHEDTGGYGVAENVQAIAAADPQQQQAQAEGGGEAPGPVKTIVREAEKVGRNDPCPCGSGKKYKKCCGVNAA
jgi:preprotein translocase subunit SecA